MSDWRPWRRVSEEELASYVTTDAAKWLILDVPRFDIEPQINGRAEILKAIYEALLAKRIRYTPEKYHPSAAIQHIRTPAEILEAPGEGTCLDLAVLFCGLCLANDLLPMLIVTEGHAIAAISLTHGLPDWDTHRPGCSLFDTGPLVESARVIDLIDDGSFVAIECTGFAVSERLNQSDQQFPETVGRTGGVLSFERAVTAGREQLERSARPFAFAIDVAVAHFRWRIPSYHIEPASSLSTIGLQRDGIGFAETHDPIDSSSPYWIDRAAVEHLRRCIQVPGQWAHILAARDVGKSSTLYAALRNTETTGAHVVVVDFNEVSNLLSDLPSICALVISEALLSVGLLQQDEWDSRGQPMTNFRRAFGRQILPYISSSLVLALDHIERLFAIPDYSTFFSGLRACHSRRLIENIWNRFGLVLVGRSDPFGLVTDADRSPVTVGEEVVVGDFTDVQVAELNRRHGRPVQAEDFSAFMALTGGHPRLVQFACKEISKQPDLSLPELERRLVSTATPLGRMLHHGLDEIREAGLTRAMAMALSGTANVEDPEIRRLALMGWVTTSNQGVRARCGLFERFFQARI